MDNYEKFKSLLEYFVSHLAWKETGNLSHVGYNTYIKPLKDTNNFVEQGQGYNNGAIQNQICQWDEINNHKLFINIQPNFGSWRSRKCYLNWCDTGINIFCDWTNDSPVGLIIGYAYWWENPTKYDNLSQKTIKQLGLFQNGITQELISFLDDFTKEIDDYDQHRGNYFDKELEWKSMKNIENYLNILRSNKNLILTGAPGTGKTYLAKQIAKAMGCTDNEIGFVQFHPSYDYTDFLEGLRPIQVDNENVGFEHRDGIFKAFCAKALKNYLDSQKSPNSFHQQTLIYSLLDDFIQNAIDNGTIFHTATKNNFRVIGDSDKRIKILIELPGIKNNEIGIPKKDLIKLLENDNNNLVLKDVREICGRKVRIQSDSYVFTLYSELRILFEKEKEKINNSHTPENLKKFVFVIDEINRGEISKIFGELFFSIDPEYRGTAGKVRTQYATMQTEEANDFDDALGITDPENYGHFFVPENVYIIGTMNDIDRSVESMDFAFRRRFAFKEVTAKESQKMLDSEDAWKGEKPNDATIQAIKNRMDNLNNVIWHKLRENEKDEEKTIEGLSSAYHIGASYFLKLANYRNNGTYDDSSFKNLWDFHLEGLLREYLRGMQDVDNLIEKLSKAYNNESAPNRG